MEVLSQRSYNISISQEELDKMHACLQVLNGISKTMLEYKCNRLESYDVEMPNAIYYKDIFDTMSILSAFLDEPFIKMS